MSSGQATFNSVSFRALFFTKQMGHTAWFTGLCWCTRERFVGMACWVSRQAAFGAQGRRSVDWTVVVAGCCTAAVFLRFRRVEEWIAADLIREAAPALKRSSSTVCSRIFNRPGIALCVQLGGGTCCERDVS